MICAICEKRPAKRFCPAKGEKICAVCCGTGRESTIDCLPDCTYLLSAHRYEAEHRPPPGEAQIAFPDIAVPPEFLHERWPLVAEIASAIVAFQMRNPDLRDPGVLAVLESLAEAYRTLVSGIYFERPPAAPLLHALYTRVIDCLREFRASAASRLCGTGTFFTSLFFSCALPASMAMAGRSRAPSSDSSASSSPFPRSSLLRLRALSCPESHHIRC